MHAAPAPATATATAPALDTDGELTGRQVGM